MLSLYIMKCFDDLAISRCETGFEWVKLTFDFMSRMKLPNSKDEINFDLLISNKYARVSPFRPPRGEYA